LSSDFKNSKWHVLVVDDDPAMRDMIADYLMAQNIRASTAADRQQMVHVLAAGGIDLAVLDLKLGHESGFDAVRALRTVSDLPIIMLTGQYRDEVDRIVGLELGADDYLTKPFSPRELLARIRAVLRRSEQRSQLGSDVDRSARIRDVPHAPPPAPKPVNDRAAALERQMLPRQLSNSRRNATNRPA